MSNTFWIGIVGALAALFFAVAQRKKVMAFSEGNDTMKKIAAAIREGANAYLKHQYVTVSKVFAVVFVVLLGLAWAGMLEALQNGYFEGENDIVFVHTGGTAALFAMDLPNA